MKTTQANLAHLYQQPNLRCIYPILIFAITAIPIVIFWTKHSFEISVVFSAGIYGIAALIASHYIDTMTKPMAFCLPGHSLILRKILFRMGFVICIIFAVFFAVCNTTQYLLLPYHLLIYSSLYMLFWSTGVWIAASVRINSVFGLFMPLGFGIGYFIHYYPTQPFLFSFYGIAIILVSWIITRLLWKRLGNPDIARKYCNQPEISLFYLSEKDADRKMEKESLAYIKAEEQAAFLRIERFFLGLIEKYRAKPIYAVISGTVYQFFGQHILLTIQSKGLILLFFVVALSCFLGYCPTEYNVLLWFFLTVPLCTPSVQKHSNLLLIHGRTERYLSEILVLIIQIAIGFGWAFLIILLMQLLAPVATLLNLKYEPANWMGWPIFIGIAPVVVIIKSLIFEKNIAIGLAGVLGFLFITVVIEVNIIKIKTFLAFLQNHWNPMMTGLLLVCVWVIFAAYLYWVCFYKDLGAGRN